MTDCVVCGNKDCNDAVVIQGHTGKGEILHNFDCPRCGQYVLTRSALDVLLASIDHQINRSILSHRIRRTQPQDSRPVQLKQSDLSTYSNDDQPPTPQEQADNLILNIGKRQTSPVSKAEFHLHEIAALVGAAVDHGDPRESAFLWLLNELGEANFRHKAKESNRYLFDLTMNGWKAYDALRRKEIDSYRAFMAMKFGDAALDEVLVKCFKPAVHEAGFSLESLADNQSAGLIDNQIRASIRTAAFIIADLSHDNNGAYFEAGFAEGLGLPVIYTCEEKKFNESKTHFDTNHMVTIPWNIDNLDEAKIKLTATIRATLPTRAKLQDD